MAYHSVDLTTPWTPTSHNRNAPLVDCTFIEDLIDNNAQPSTRVERDWEWARLTLLQKLDKSPQTKDAVWECVVALWRLRQVEPIAFRDLTWQRHTLSWLYRYHDIVWEYHLEPLGILVEWSSSLILRGFSVGDIPHLSDPPPTIEEEQAQEEGLQQIVDDLLGNVDDAEDLDGWLRGVRQRTEKWKDEVGDPQNPRHLQWIQEILRRTKATREEIVERELENLIKLERERQKLMEVRSETLIKVLDVLDRDGPHNLPTRFGELIMLRGKTRSSDPEYDELTQLLMEELDKLVEEESSEESSSGR